MEDQLGVTCKAARLLTGLSVMINETWYYGEWLFP
jgi:hypothetical protein